MSKKNIINIKKFSNILNFKTILLKIFITAIFVTSYIKCLSESKTEIGTRTPIENEQNNNNENGDKNIETPVCIENQILEENKCIDTYNVIFNTNDGNLIENINNIKEGDIINLPIPVKAGYVFKNWSLNGVIEVEFPFTMPNNNVTLIANWELVNHIIVFDTNGGVSLSSLINLTFGQEFNFLPTPQFLGYEFKGWFLEEDGVGKIEKPVLFPFKIVTKYNLIKAKWQFIPYTIFFNSTTNDGENINNKTNLKVGSIVTLPTPIKTGYTFLGWQSVDVLLPHFNFIMPANDVTLVAWWSLNYYTLNFDTNGGLNNINFSNINHLTFGQKINLNFTPSKTGYTFLGWQSVDVTPPHFNFIMPANDVTLVAWWSLNYYTLNFDTNGGLNNINFSNINHLTFGQKINLANTPIKTGYTFLGWQSIEVPPPPLQASPVYPENGTNQVLLINSNYFNMPANNVTLVAWWTLNYYTLNFDLGDIASNTNFTKIEHITFGQTLTINKVPTLTNYSFTGWSFDGKSIGNSINFPPKNSILKATWKCNLNKVDCDNDGLIEIYSINDLDKIRFNLEGTSWKTSLTDKGTSSGCPVIQEYTMIWMSIKSEVCRGYELMNNLNFTGSKWESGGVEESWLPIGTFENHFSATFEGNGFTISNLYIKNKKSDFQGLFNITAKSAEIKNLGLVNLFIIAQKISGGLAGSNSGKIENCFANGIILSSENFENPVAWQSIDSFFMGGLVGVNDGVIENSFADVSITGKDINKTFIGGLVGYQNDGIVINSYSTGHVSNALYIGGLIGQLWGTVYNSYSSCNVYGGDVGSNVGGLVGFLGYGNISKSYASGNVEYGSNVGGLVGQSWASINNSYSLGDVIGNESSIIGGLVGQLQGRVENSYSKSKVTGKILNNRKSINGGLVGLFESGFINNSYAQGNVSIGGNVGGLVGNQKTNTQISSSFAKGTVSGSVNVGGLVGLSYSTITNSFANGNVYSQSNYASIGALIGNQNQYSLSMNNFASGDVVNMYNDSNVGGLVGYQYNSKIENNYYIGNIESSGNSCNVGGASW